VDPPQEVGTKKDALTRAELDDSAGQHHDSSGKIGVLWVRHVKKPDKSGFIGLGFHF
jgi:hypothetical protein